MKFVVELSEKIMEQQVETTFADEMAAEISRAIQEQKPVEQPVLETVVETPIPQKEEPKVEVVEQERKGLSDILSVQPKQEDEQFKKIEGEVVGKLKPDLDLASLVKSSPLLSYLAQNINKPDFDIKKAFLKTDVDYSKMDAFDLHLEVGKQAGIELTPEQVEEEKEIISARLSGMSPLERDKFKKDLIAQIKKPEDNTGILDSELARRDEILKLQQEEKDKEALYWKSKEDYLLGVKEKLVGIELAGITTTPEMVSNIYSKLGKSYGGDRYIDENGDYRPEWELEDLMYAEVGRNAESIIAKAKEEAKKEGKIEAIQERQNASQNTTESASTGMAELTPDQKQRRMEIHIAYKGKPELIQEELKKEGLI